MISEGDDRRDGKWLFENMVRSIAVDKNYGWEMDRPQWRFIAVRKGIEGTDPAVDHVGESPVYLWPIKHLIQLSPITDQHSINHEENRSSRPLRLFSGGGKRPVPVVGHLPGDVRIQYARCTGGCGFI